MDLAETTQTVLATFRVYFSAIVRAIDQGALVPIMAGSDYKGTSIEIEGIRWGLSEKTPGALFEIVAGEHEALLQDLENMRVLLSIAKSLNHQNAKLRALLGNPEEAITTVVRDPLTQELISSRTIKRKL